MRSVYVIALLSILFSACDTGRVYEGNKDFARREWAANDTAGFTFRIQPPGGRYNLHLNVRNSRDYKWSRLFVKYSLEDSLGTVLSSELLTNYLFEVKTGKPFGRSGLGDLYDHRFGILKNYDLEPGTYRLTLRQLMREDTLKGILAAGVRVERSESTN